MKNAPRFGLYGLLIALLGSLAAGPVAAYSGYPLPCERVSCSTCVTELRTCEIQQGCYNPGDPNCVCQVPYRDCLASCLDRTGCVVDSCTSCAQPAPGIDADGDQVPDRLEYDLAHKFFPSVRLQHSDVDLQESFLYLGRAVPYTVHSLPMNGICNEDKKCLELRIGIAYRADRGDDVFGEGHLGDSEFYAAVLLRSTPWSVAAADANSWSMVRDFTSAHWRSGAESSRIGAYGDVPPNCHSWDSNASSCSSHSYLCSWFPGTCGLAWNTPIGVNCTRYFNDSFQCQANGCSWIDAACSPRVDIKSYSAVPLPGPVVVYASEGKHANYHTDGECDSGGALGFDDCPYNQYDMRAYKGNLLQNIGEFGSHAAFDRTIQDPDLCGSYDMWLGLGFECSTNYKSHFNYIFDWALPPASPPPPPPPACSPCGEAGCTAVQASYGSHFTGLDCTGQESYYTPYFNTDGVRRSWNGGGCAGTTLQTVTNRSWRGADGICYNSWPSGNTLSGFVKVYRTPVCACGEGACSPVQAAYGSHYTGLGCTGLESYYTPYFNTDGIRRSWDGTGCVGTTLRTVTHRSFRDASGACHDDWPNGNTLSGFVRVYRAGRCVCGEAGCQPVQAAYGSHFTGAGCSGEEYYYTPYFNSDGVRRSWDGKGCVGNTLRTVTSKSFKDASGVCHDDWPNGNTLSGFVRVYR